MTELCFMTIGELAPLIKDKKISPVELTDSFLGRIEKLDARFNCFITVTADAGHSAARAAEQSIMSGGYRGPLHGIPIALKDLFMTQGIRTTAGSKIFADFIPEADGTVVSRLKAAGAVILGKTNLHEFAWGATSDNPHFGAVHNPWDPARIPGGSSGGSAAAIAAGLCVAALGTDTGGSVREPAALCGNFGLKPTYGRVSRHGIFPLSWSLDHAGPMTRNVADAAILLNAIAGKDARDPASSGAPVPDFTDAIGKPITELKVGIPRDFFFQDVDSEVISCVDAAIAELGRQGISIEPVSIPTIRYAPTLSWVIIGAEAYSNHEQTFKTRYADYGRDIRSNLEIVAFTLANHYLKAQRVRRLLTQEIMAVLKKVDAIITPTTPVPAIKIGERAFRVGEREINVAGGLNRLTSPFNLAGVPALSMPCGFTPSGLPVGVQMVGRPFDEVTLLSLAAAYERSTDWHSRRPPGLDANP